jgi:polyferredoxin
VSGTGPGRGIHRFRRAFQLVSLIAFLTLLTFTVWPLGNVFLGSFLVGDPLIALNSAFGGTLRVEMWLAVAMLLAPLIIGRAFCGYVCPMGALLEWTSPRTPERPAAERTRARRRAIPTFVLLGVAGMPVSYTHLTLPTN